MWARLVAVLIFWIAGLVGLSHMATWANGAPFLLGTAVLFWGGCGAFAWAGRAQR